MANKKNVTVEAQIDQEIEAAVDKTQNFFDKNGKTITYVLIAIVAVVAAIFGYQKFVKEPRAEKAAAAMYMAQFRFEGENADYELALNGDEEGAGFLDVIEQYGSTPAGNLAAQYAGICYMKLGDWDNAEKYLAQYKATKGVPNAVVNAENLGLQGDVKVQKGDYKKAAALFEQAAAVADNNFTTPLYLKKAALAYEAAGDTAAALKTYKRIATEYAASVEARDAEKMLGQE
ncbi:MAG: tetratricopeptide repeat protein [Rikenellaceae bacterium]|nr:tetratricopeptide repeat protein [Rikenellaceae bacterium]